MFICIKAMSESHKNIQDKLKSCSEQLIEHIIRLVIYPNCDTSNHWKQEIWNFLHQVDKLKGKNKFPSSSFIKKSISTHNDMIKELVWIVEDLEEDLVPIEVSEDKILRAVESYQEWISNELSIHGVARRSDVYAKLDDLLK